VLSANVSAKATAEAYNPGAGGPPVGPTCLKSWLLPNCDPNHTGPVANTSCIGTTAAKFVDPSCGTTGICNPGNVAQGGVVGALLNIKLGSPSQANAPSKYYPVDLPITSAGSLCPACANGGSGGGGIPSGNVYFSNIACCNQNPIPCGSKQVQPIVGNKVGETAGGVDCLIHQGPNGSGQDTINTSVTPFQMTGGSNNPIPALQGQPIQSSDSIVTIPLYDGSQLCPGLGTCGVTTVISESGCPSARAASNSALWRNWAIFFGADAQKQLEAHHFPQCLAWSWQTQSRLNNKGPVSNQIPFVQRRPTSCKKKCTD